jgi:BED zinc finger
MWPFTPHHAERDNMEQSCVDDGMIRGAGVVATNNVTGTTTPAAISSMTLTSAPAEAEIMASQQKGDRPPTLNGTAAMTTKQNSSSNSGNGGADAVDDESESLPIGTTPIEAAASSIVGTRAGEEIDDMSTTSQQEENKVAGENNNNKSFQELEEAAIAAANAAVAAAIEQQSAVRRRNDDGVVVGDASADDEDDDTESCCTKKQKDDGSTTTAAADTQARAAATGTATTNDDDGCTNTYTPTASAATDAKTRAAAAAAADLQTRAVAVAARKAPPPPQPPVVVAAAGMKQNETVYQTEVDDETHQNFVTLYLGRNTYVIPALPLSCFAGLDDTLPRPCALLKRSRLVTKPHPSLQHVGVISPYSEPGSNRSSPWWIPFSVINPALQENENASPLDGPYCNFCGKAMKFGKEQSSSRLKRHVQRRHREVFAMLTPIFNKMDTASSSSNTLSKVTTMTAAASSASNPMTRTVLAASSFVGVNSSSSSNNNETVMRNGRFIENSVAITLGSTKYTIPALPHSFFRGLDDFPEFWASSSSTLRLVAKPHPKVQDIVMSPFSIDNPRRQSPWWLLFSVANRNLKVTQDVPPLAAGIYCNLCARQIGRDLSPYKLKIHLQNHHPEAFAILETIFSSGKEIESHLPSLQLSARNATADASTSTTTPHSEVETGLYDLSADDIRAMLEKEKKEVQELEEKLRNKEKDDLIRALNETRQRKEIIKRKLGCHGNSDNSSSSFATTTAPPTAKRPAAPSTTQSRPAVTTRLPKSSIPLQTAEEQQEESRAIARLTAATFQHQVQQQQEQDALQKQHQARQDGGCAAKRHEE